MPLPKTWALAGIAGIALFCGPAFAQVDEQKPAPDPSAQTDGNATQDSAKEGEETDSASNPDAVPDPAKTETPELPAAAGGTASDATRSGGPASSADSTDESDGSAAPDPDSTTGDDKSQEPRSDNSGASPVSPRNAVGDKFELPQVRGDNQHELIAGLCGIQMKAMSKDACDCLATQAMESLSDPQRDYLIASAVAPPVADRMINDGRVAQPDQEAIFSFLNATSDACVTGKFEPKTQGSAPATEPGASSATQKPDDSRGDGAVQDGSDAAK